MGRKLYQVMQEDMDGILLYLRNNTQPQILNSWESWSRFCRADTPELLQRWCDDYLTPKQWQRIKNYIIAHRKLDDDYLQRRQNNSTQMDELALMRLNKLVERDETSLTEIILLMEELYIKANTRSI